MLERRMAAEARAQVRGRAFGAVGLAQVSVPDVFFLADVAQKASDVVAVELHGNCPQHITTLALFGETSAVATAVQAIREEAKAW